MASHAGDRLTRTELDAKGKADFVPVIYVFPNNKRKLLY